ncbi:MAG TPA: class I tRNA ligase family protein, partial [Roseiarcus sp.]
SDYGVDQLRYFFLREAPFGQDGNYSHEAIVQRINADLANDLGNLAQRSLSMIAKNCGASVPDWRSGEVRAEDFDLLSQADGLLDAAREHMRAYQLHAYLAAVFEVVAKANRYFANNEPWKLAKTDPARMRVVLFTTIETLRIAAILLQPVMPAAMSKLLDLLAVGPEKRDFASLDAGAGVGRIEAPHRLGPGAALPAPSPVFPRYLEPQTAGA